MITAIVPARAGSKRLADKNVRLLNGRPLVFYTIDAVLGHEPIKDVIFSSDSLRYIELVREEYGDRVTLEQRPTEFATEKTKVRNEVERLNREGLIGTEWFMLCLPTAPFRTKDTVARLLGDWAKDRRARFTATSYSFPIQFGFEIDEKGDWLPCFEDSPMVSGNTRSQDIPPRYRPTGAIYLQQTKPLVTSSSFYVNAKPFLTDIYESLDIDTLLDFKIAELIMREGPERA
jgi:CMP-N,N'-diacetyllegionaminic acid synthase